MQNQYQKFRPQFVTHYYSFFIIYFIWLRRCHVLFVVGFIVYFYYLVIERASDDQTNNVHILASGDRIDLNHVQLIGSSTTNPNFLSNSLTSFGKKLKPITP